MASLLKNIKFTIVYFRIIYPIIILTENLLHYIFDENISILNILNEYIFYILLIPTPYF